MAAGARPPKLSGIVQYFYSVCPITSLQITETITIEVFDQVAATFGTSSIVVTNGNFDSTLLSIT
jgi:hypothetical protein